MLEAAILKAIDAVAPWCKELLKAQLDRINRQRQKTKAKTRTRAKKGELDAARLAATSIDAEDFVSGNFLLKTDETIARLKLHVDDVASWSSRVRFRDMTEERLLQDIYVELDIYLTPVRLHMNSNERRRVKPLKASVFDSPSHCVILGQPGAGKTTSMQRVCSLFFESTGTENYRLPILVRFRSIDYAQTAEPIRRYISGLLLYELTLTNAFAKSHADGAATIDEDIFCAALDQMQALIVLEGFDEIPHEGSKASALREIRGLCSRLKRSKVIVTCRSGEFNYSIEGCRVLEIAPLTSDQISALATKWFTDPSKVPAFMESVLQSPFADTSIKPLTLAHLCAIYERTGSIPEKPKSVYKKIVWLYLSEWDEQRSVYRATSYAKFDIDRKFEFLAHMSYILTSVLRAAEFSDGDIETAYYSVCGSFGLEKSECRGVTREIESHTGLLIQVEHHRYSFAHKSLQEYLAAEYLVRLPSLRTVRKPDLLGAEFAIATALSSNSSLYLAEVFLGMYVGEQVTRQFYDAFMSRLQVEKPDFYPCEELLLALATILSLAVDHTPYLTFFSSLLSRCDRAWLLYYYKPNIIDPPLTEAVPCTEYLRLAHHDAFQLKHRLIIPDALIHLIQPSSQQKRQ